jgi:hypothetical protein
MISDLSKIYEAYSKYTSRRMIFESNDALMDEASKPVSPEEAAALQDNAQGSSNFAAPGAHRYKTDLTLEKRTIETIEDKDFVELLRVRNGQIQYKVRTLLPDCT